MNFLKKAFGSSKKEIWSQIADEIGGEFLDHGFWKTDALIYRHKEWQLVLDTFSRQAGNNNHTFYTRMRAPFINKDQLYLKIYRKHFFSFFEKLFGMQDIIIGDQYFDDQFIIKGNHEEKIKHLLYSEELKQLIDAHPRIHVQIKKDDGWFGKQFPEGVDQLYFECVGILKDKESLRALFELFSLLLDRLVRIDSAYEDDPNVKLI